MESQGSKCVRGRNTENILNTSHTSCNQEKKCRVRGRNVNSILTDMTNSQSAENYQMKSSYNDSFKPGSDPINMRINALSDSSKENQNPLIMSTKSSLGRSSSEHSQCTKPSPLKQSLRTNNAEYLSHNPLKCAEMLCNKPSPLKQSLRTNNAKYLSHNPLKTINGNSFSQSPLEPLLINLESFSGIENKDLKNTKLQDINVQICNQPISGDLSLCLENLGKQSRCNLDTTEAEKNPMRVRRKNCSYREHKVFLSTLTDDPIFSESIVHTPVGNVSPSDASQTSGVHICGETCATPNTPCIPKLRPMGFEGSSSFDTSSVKSTYEQGESSGSKNLLGDFNNVKDCDSSNSDCDCDDVDVHEFDNTITKWSEYLDVGDPDKICSKCQAIMWNHERNNKCAPRKPPTFSLCCKNGQIILEKEKQPPEPLASLLSGGSCFRYFKENIRMYNCMFSMSFTGGQIDRSINRGGAPYCFKVKGVNYHIMGSFVPLDGEIPKFCQLYIYDIEDEVHNRINAVKRGRDVVDEDIVQFLLEMLDEHNHLVKGFYMAHERISKNAVDEFRLVLISSSSASGRPNHIGPSNEVVGLIVTDDYAKGCRDTIIHSRTNGLERIFEIDPRFMQTQNTENEDPDEKGEREFITMKEYYNYKLMIRPSEGLTPHLGGHLWQQYVVEAFTAIEQYRLDWIRGHKTTIHSDIYHNIRDALKKDDSNPENIDKAIILLASFTGSKRYRNQYFKDAMAICGTLKHPSLFLTMTTNTKWPKIQQMLKFLPGVDVVDAPDVVARFDIHSRWPSIERSPIHLPNDKHVSFKGSQNLQEVCDNAGTKKSKLKAWFDTNKIYVEAKNLTYSEFPSKFTWHPQPGIWKQRKRGDVIGRLPEVHSSNGELLYLRMLLLRIKGTISFDDLKTVNDHIYNSFHEACVMLGILQNNQQWHKAIAENTHTSMPPQIRAMFVNILVYSPISHPHSLWEAHWGCMSDAIVLVRRHLTDNSNLCLSDFEIQNYALAEIEKLLNDIGKSLRNFPDMPFLGDEEAHMQHHHAFECGDRSLRVITSAIDKRGAKKPFCSITIVFGGDFLQIHPVIPKASRVEVVCSTLNKSKLWESCEIFLLKQNMRLNAGNIDVENKTIADFSKWQLAVGDGKEINISPSPDNGEISRDILIPTNIVVDEINTRILEKIPGTIYTYLSQDSIDDASDDDNDFISAFLVEYLNSINMPYITKHELKLKVGVVIMLMRNLNQIMGLCNGTRMIVKSCRKNTIECEILCGSHVGTKHLIPRIEMILSDTNWPFEFKRVQFPIHIYYAMTINKSQGQSLDMVGLYLPRATFVHGHIYVAISRVTRPEGLHILIDSDYGGRKNITNNVVFEEVLYNLPSIDN
ncbi:uncharacterized protein LOC141700767 [Apium graveolens]|uniref:uncharacterized protein LOC141700767 n=1 Tax=Apium graveolens TaxID=4045 RepID=UPI003D7AA3D6